jgi:hypothetical protein
MDKTIRLRIDGRAHEGHADPDMPEEHAVERASKEMTA